MTPVIQFGRNRNRHVLAFALVLLLAVFAYIETAHVHSDGQLDSLRCSICLSAHHSTGIVSAPPAAPELALSQAPTPVPQCTFTPAAPAADLFSRPPPTV